MSAQLAEISASDLIARPASFVRGAAWRKPGADGSHQGGDAGGQGGLEHGGVERRVVGRQVPYRGRDSGLGRDAGEVSRVGAAEEPVHARGAGRDREQADVLAAGDRPGIEHPVSPEPPGERRADAVGRLLVVDHGAEAVGRLDDRLTRGAEAAASARTMRPIASSTRPRTAGSTVRTLSSSSASSGIIFSFVPARRAPTVTTAVSSPATSRETTPCNRMTVAAAITTGSTPASGREPWAPRP